MRKNKVLRVGFDLDGVLLYNPARMARPFVALVKKLFFKKRQGVFHIPSSSVERFIWYVLHLSSLFVAPGLDEIKKLVKEGKIKAYIITGRYGFLQKNLDRWLKKMDADKYFTGCFVNEEDEQPHKFKERIITKLKLDLFVEDNWDVVAHLCEKFEIRNSKFEILWLCNLFDAGIKYSYKFWSLKQIVATIEKRTRKIKALLVSDYFYPHWTGLSKSVYNLTQSQQLDLDWTVLTVQHKKTLKKEENIGEVRILRTSYIFSISRVKYSLSLIGKFIAIAKNFDTIFINSPCSNILPLSLLAKLFRKRLLIFHQGDLILPKSMINRFIEQVFDFATRLSFKLADKIATYTEDYAKHSRVMKNYLYKFTPLLLPSTLVRVAEWKGSRQRAMNMSTGGREMRSGPADKITFGFAGRFVQEKGIDILLDAIPKVLQKLPNARFLFAGQPMSYEKDFENWKLEIENLKPHLTFLGLLNDKKLTEFYSSIDFIIVPSRSDCFNMVQAEAMLSGVPSIVADIPGARYLVKQSGFGMLFEMESSDDLASKIIQASKLQSFNRSKYDRVLEILDNQKNAYKIKEFIEGRD